VWKFSRKCGDENVKGTIVLGVVNLAQINVRRWVSNIDYCRHNGMKKSCANRYMAGT